MGVREPAAYGDSMLWVEDVGGGGIIDDDGFFKVATNL